MGRLLTESRGMPAAWAGHPGRLLVTHIVVRKEKRERNRGRSVAGDSSRLRLLSEGYNPDHHPSLSPSPRRGYAAAPRLFPEVFSINWYQSHSFWLSGSGVRQQSSDLRIFLLSVSSACRRFSVYCLSVCRLLYLDLDLQKENKSHGENLFVRGRINRRETPSRRFKSRAKLQEKSKVKYFTVGKKDI
ncbi:hypothetical protein M9H77_28394 [Catharanthus roseus]|uniref:Uncharacterized protein n=1 Tax=Catharanthus roseus TaxID=4058 RepID=A0ACC0AG79_CATRO|nr:hypothetical protein M9H77_28394 [Catharanthus roseus]